MNTAPDVAAQGGIQFQAFALRGRSELNESDDTMFCMLPDLVAESGLNNLSNLELSDLKRYVKLQ